MIPALEVATSEAVNFNWLAVVTEVIGTVDIQRTGSCFCVRKIGLRLRNGDLVVFRIDLDQDCPFLHVLVSSTFTLTHVS